MPAPIRKPPVAKRPVLVESTQVQELRRPVEETPDTTGKTFAVKLPPKLTARVLDAMKDIEIDSNAAFLRKCIEVAMPIMQEHSRGTTFTGTRDDGSTFEVMIAG